MPFGVVAGGVLGLLISPAIAALLYLRELRFAIPLVLFPTLIVAIVGGWSTNPAIALLSVIVFVASAIVAYLAMPALPRFTSPTACVNCGYDRSGLSVCPECGTSGTVAPKYALSRPMRTAAVILAAVLGIGLPLSLAAYAAYDRHRSRTIEEWVERLGHNDMQIQWEARQAVAKAGSGPAIQALAHPNPAVRRNAAWVLQDLRDPAAKSVLQAALQDPDPWVRDHAQKALNGLR